jgi:hypothetical protein
MQSWLISADHGRRALFQLTARMDIPAECPIERAANACSSHPIAQSGANPALHVL